MSANPKEGSDSDERLHGSTSPFAITVLEFLESRDFEGAPRFLGRDSEGKPRLTRPGGEVVHVPGQATEIQRISAGQFLRRFHDLMATSSLRGDEETVIHGDAGLHNMVFEDQKAVGLIDWEFCRSGPRLGEIADVCWTFFDDTWNDPKQERAARTIGLRVADFLLGYDWNDNTAVFEEIKRQMAKALADHCELGYEESVVYFERQTGWLAEHELEFLAAAGSGKQY